MQQLPSSQEPSISESFQDFYYSFIDQLPNLGMGLLIIILGVLLGSWIGNFARSRISRRTNDPLMSKFLGKSIRIVLIIIAIMIGLRAAGLGGIATGIIRAAGARAGVVGVAFKEIEENFIAEIILSCNEPLYVTDPVEVRGTFEQLKEL